MPSATDFLNEPETAPSASAFLEEEPTVTVTQPEGGDGFLAKVNAALRKPTPYAGLRNFEDATRKNIMAMAPHDLPSYLESLYLPVAKAKEAASTLEGLTRGDVSGIPLVGRIPEIAAADETPAFSEERIGTGERTVNDLLMLAGFGERAPLPLRGEPLATPELPPSPNLGPGTIAGDVSRALERQQVRPPEPPPVEVQQPGPSGFSATMREPWETPEAPVQAPEVPATASEPVVPGPVAVSSIPSAFSKVTEDGTPAGMVPVAEMRTIFGEHPSSVVADALDEGQPILANTLETLGLTKETSPLKIDPPGYVRQGDVYVKPAPSVDIAALQKRKAQIEASIAPSRAIGQKVHPSVEAELEKINGQLGVPPVNAQEGPALASEAPGGVPVAGFKADVTHYTPDAARQFSADRPAYFHPAETADFSNLEGETQGAIIRGSVEFKNPITLPAEETVDISPARIKELREKGYDGIVTDDGSEVISLNPKVQFKEVSRESPTGTVIEPPPPPAVEIPEADRAYAGGGTQTEVPGTVGISQARTEAELGPGSVVPGAGAEMGSGLAYGREYVNRGGDPRLPIRRANTSGMVGKNDVGIVHAELDRLRVERNKAAAALETNPADPVLQQNFSAADDAQRAWRKELQPVLTKASDALREAHAASMPDADVGTYQGLADLMDEHFKGERTLSSEERTALAKAAKGVKASRDIANGEMAKVEGTLEKQVRARGKKMMSPEELEASIKNRLETEFVDCVLGA